MPFGKRIAIYYDCPYITGFGKSPGSDHFFGFLLEGPDILADSILAVFHQEYLLGFLNREKSKRTEHRFVFRLGKNEKMCMPIQKGLGHQ